MNHTNDSSQRLEQLLEPLPSLCRPQLCDCAATDPSGWRSIEVARLRQAHQHIPARELLCEAGDAHSEHVEHVVSQSASCIGNNVAVVDVSHKTRSLRAFFDANGRLRTGEMDALELAAFAVAQNALEIDLPELEAILHDDGTSLYRLEGLLLYTGLGQLRAKNGAAPLWERIEAYAPYLSFAACERLLGTGIRLLGTDALMLDHPCAHFDGTESLFAANPTLWTKVQKQQSTLPIFLNHRICAEYAILLYENLHLPPSLTGKRVCFSGISFPCMTAEEGALSLSLSHR